MKKTTIKIGGLIVAIILTATTAQSQELIPDPDELINDYISLGEFNEAGNTEGWGQNSINLSVENGVLRVTTIGGDPHFFVRGIQDAPVDFHLVEMRFRVLERVEGRTDLFWGDETAPGFAGARRYGHYPWPEDEEFTIVQYDLDGILNGALTDLRFDPANGAGVVLEVDYVRFGRISDDSDEDGLPDTVETDTGEFIDARDTGTDPDEADTDGDGFNDGVEVSIGTDPTNSTEFPVEGIKNYTLNKVIILWKRPLRTMSQTYRLAARLHSQSNLRCQRGLPLTQRRGQFQEPQRSLVRRQITR